MYTDVDYKAVTVASCVQMELKRQTV